jgi:hypothetical protein
MREGAVSIGKADFLIGKIALSFVSTRPQNSQTVHVKKELQGFHNFDREPKLERVQSPILWDRFVSICLKSSPPLDASAPDGKK